MKFGDITPQEMEIVLGFEERRLKPTLLKLKLLKEGHFESEDLGAGALVG